ncbi:MULTISPECIES: holo-ACP synthase [Veillonella]|jgi:holo-[acyl-carrier-protein] synthase|uniref:Holo-[acyl-carrier-protein] synthase n=1 Tax=Veillonella rogosae JCM 15642 TaxID=1298595 RepID=A0ABX5BVA4_9FIRM|nr:MULTISPECIES: holo-ACP synthase [Veillonella]MBF1745807.1 holo-ACP synthase [Veillonella sp.]MDU5494222.1 holo-ACP synthase [Veillonella sp.]MDU6206214.1 holo-ACP synthase [Veillonella sp.]PQL10527.1 holo-[acyl-carrier-protein] synthase [Veillonella rogosae JCM 15642]
MKLGNDIIEIERIRQAIERSSLFVERVYTPHEIDYCESRNKGRYESFAGIYAAKEAFIKALGTGMRHGSWQDIEIYHDELGAPLIRLQDTFKNIYETLGYTNIHVSISHCKEYAMSTVILEGA